MPEYKIRALTPADASAVLEFELANKSFFAQSIEARPDDFYQLEAVQLHIADFIALNQQGLALATLIFNSADELIGRATIKDIDMVSQSAYVGYRIAEQWSGHGVASFALQALIRQAKLLKLRMLLACVSTENQASKRVLVKAGFQQMETIPKVAIVQGKTLDGYLMWLKL